MAKWTVIVEWQSGGLTASASNIEADTEEEAMRAFVGRGVVSDDGLTRATKVSAFPTQEAGPLILRGSTTGLLNYFGSTASIRPAKRPLFRNTSICFTQRIANSWLT